MERIGIEEVEERRARTGMQQDREERNEEVANEIERKKQERANAIRERQSRLGHIEKEE